MQGRFPHVPQSQWRQARAGEPVAANEQAPDRFGGDFAEAPAEQPLRLRTLRHADTNFRNNGVLLDGVGPS